MTKGLPTTLAIIPARGGSKGLPGKNLAKVGCHSLIGWAVKSALESSCVSRTVVSTDCPEIEAEARLYGAEIPFLRPADLATDTATSVEVALHCLEFLRESEGLCPDWLLLLQPTSPLRTSEDVDTAFSLIKDRNCQAIVSVNEPSQHPMLAKIIDPDDRYLRPLFPHSLNRRQDLPRVYQPNGALYFVRVEALLKEHTFYPERTLGYVMSPTRSVDIDNASDLELARFLLR